MGPPFRVRGECGKVAVMVANAAKDYERRYRITVTGSGIPANVTMALNGSNAMGHLMWASKYRQIGTGRAYTDWKIYDQDTGRTEKGKFPCHRKKFELVLKSLSSRQLSLSLPISSTNPSSVISGVNVK